MQRIVPGMFRIMASEQLYAGLIGPARFPPPSVIVLADDLFAVPGHSQLSGGQDGDDDGPGPGPGQRPLD
jgi:hypothetical protein